MANQKLENLLNLSLSATSEELADSSALNSVLSPVNAETPTEDLWDIILRYAGSLEEILSSVSAPIRAVPLYGGYAILTLPKSAITPLSTHPLVQFIEQPKQIFTGATSAQSASCIPPVTRPPYNLSGEGILIGVVDSGLDFTHPAFRDGQGRTRVVRFWDQSGDPSIQPPPSGYLMGSEYTQAEIQKRLDNGTSFPRDISGHGTAVTGIAAGGTFPDGSGFYGVAPAASLAIVRLAPSSANSFPRTSELMQGVNYLVQTAIQLRMPLAINISLGNTYGSHDGTSLLESFLSAVSNLWKITICIGSGNEGNDSGHTLVNLSSFQSTPIEFSISPFEQSLNIQLWKSFLDTVQLRLISPDGESIQLPVRPGPYRYRLEDTFLLAYYGEPGPYSASQEIFFNLLPQRTYLNSGIWQLVIETGVIVNGQFNFWMNDSAQRNFGTRFLTPTPELTLTIPSTALNCITVGSYDDRQKIYSDFSGRGFTRIPVRVKPDLAAPGVNISAPAVGGGTALFTGTSFACPFVTGSAALLMEWGIQKGNDPFLFGEKVKAYLQKSARPIAAEREYPNPRLGYGTLCILSAILLS